MKNKSVIMWIITVICFILTIVFWFLMNNAEIQYEEVTAYVLDTSSDTIVNKKTGSRTTFYKVRVKYEGEEYDLQNVHSLSQYSEGKSVKALLSNGKLYANEEGIKSTSPIAIIYFIFLFGTFGMVILSSMYMSKTKAKKQEEIKS